MADPKRLWPWGTLALCLLAGVNLPFLLLVLFRQASPQVTWGWLLLFGIAIGSWLFFSVWTWRRLARTRLAPDGRLIYDFGVLGWGVSFGLGITTVNAVQQVGGWSVPNLLSLHFVGALLQNGLVMFPLALWGGYFWGKGMGLFFSAPRHQ